jgi:hypothetical protein
MFSGCRRRRRKIKLVMQATMLCMFLCGSELANNSRIK